MCDDEEQCWLCLSSAPLKICHDASVGSSPDSQFTLQGLTLPCRCPHLFSHPLCLARWQLRNVGHVEEKSCRFCKATLPAWLGIVSKPTRSEADQAARVADTSLGSAAQLEIDRSVPVMVVHYRGQKARIPCYPGENGQRVFMFMAQKCFNIDPSCTLHANFAFKESSLGKVISGDTQEPIIAPGDVIQMRGFKAFNAAFELAKLFAEKMDNDKILQRRLTGDASEAPAAAGSSQSDAVTPSSLGPLRINGGSLLPIRGCHVGDIEIPQGTVIDQGGIPSTATMNQDPGTYRVPSTATGEDTPPEQPISTVRPSWTLLNASSWSISCCFRPQTK